MTRRDEFDRGVLAWMEEASSSDATSDGFDRAMATSARRRPLPRWLAGIGADWLGTPWWHIELAGRRTKPQQFALIAMAVFTALVIAGAAFVGASLLQPDRSILPSSGLNGWVAFTVTDDVGVSGERVRDIYLVSESSVPHRIIGVDGDAEDAYCPVLSPDGRQLAFIAGHVTAGSADRGYGLVIGAIDASGHVRETRSIAIPDASEPACPVWSPDGERIALLTPSVTEPRGYRPDFAGPVWIVTVGTSAATSMPGVLATDVAWAPDSSELAVVAAPKEAILPLVGGPILVYPVAGGEPRTIPSAANVVAVDWSPDGSRIAYQRIRTPATIQGGAMLAGTETEEIWTVDAGGGEAALQTLPFDVNHGVGPVWSPTGDRLVFQRLCTSNPVRPGNPCREQHEVVLLTPGLAVGSSSPVGTERVLPLVRLDGDAGASAWFPAAVSWSPDGRKLLYSAWSELFVSDQPGDGSVGLLIVDPDAVLAPRLLYEGAGSGSWGAQPAQ